MPQAPRAAAASGMSACAPRIVSKPLTAITSLTLPVSPQSLRAPFSDLAVFATPSRELPSSRPRGLTQGGGEDSHG